MEMTTLVWFGKYKGRPVSDVVAEDPRYAIWAHENVSGFTLAENVVADAFNRAKAKILADARARAARACRVRPGQFRIHDDLFVPLGEIGPDFSGAACDEPDAAYCGALHYADFGNN